MTKPAQYGIAAIYVGVALCLVFAGVFLFSYKSPKKALTPDVQKPSVSIPEKKLTAELRQLPSLDKDRFRIGLYLVEPSMRLIGADMRLKTEGTVSVTNITPGKYFSRALVLDKNVDKNMFSIATSPDQSDEFDGSEAVALFDVSFAEGTVNSVTLDPSTIFYLSRDGNIPFEVNTLILDSNL